jgi:predicted transcriptional regulator
MKNSIKYACEKEVLEILGRQINPKLLTNDYVKAVFSRFMQYKKTELALLSELEESAYYRGHTLLYSDYGSHDRKIVIRNDDITVFYKDKNKESLMRHTTYSLNKEGNIVIKSILNEIYNGEKFLEDQYLEKKGIPLLVPELKKFKHKTIFNQISELKSVQKIQE